MRQGSAHIIMLLFMTVIFGCASDSLGPDDLVSFVRDPENGLRQRKEFDLFYLDLQYEPLEYAALIRVGEEGLVNGRYAEEKSQLTGLQYFQLKLGSVEGKEFLRTGIASMDEYHARLEYYTSHVQDDLMLVSGTDTLPCILHHFERTYKIGPYSTLLIGFEGAEDVKSERTLIYDDRALGIGRVKFTITENSLKRLPGLKA